MGQRYIVEQGGAAIGIRCHRTGLGGGRGVGRRRHIRCTSAKHPAFSSVFFWDAAWSTSNDLDKIEDVQRINFSPSIPPARIFSSLYLNLNDFWQESIRGAEGSALEFWEALRSSPMRHPEVHPEHRWPFLIPLGVHGDAGSFSHQDSLFVVTWNSLIAGGPRTGFTRRFLYTVILKEHLTTETWVELWKVFSWSMNALLTGVSPSENWDNNPRDGGNRFLADRWSAAVVQVRGDWEFLTMNLGLARWDDKINMCMFCLASNTIEHLLWQRFGAHAGWRRTLRTHSSWLNELRSVGKTCQHCFIC